MGPSPRRFVLLDRDGTVIVQYPYLSDHRLVELLPGVGEGLRLIQRMGLGLLVVTNQSGIGRGYFDLVQLRLIHERMIGLLSAEGVSIEGIFFCPHRPDSGCGCRKPRTGLVERAAHSLGFDLSESFFIGDKPCDIEIGRKVHATTFLVRTGCGIQTERERSCSPDYVVNDLVDAAREIQDILSL